MEKEIAHWKSRIQIKKGTPSIALIKAITKPFHLRQGKEVSCSLVLNNKGKSKVVVSLESEYPPENSPELQL